MVKVNQVGPKYQDEVNIARRHIGNVLQNKKHAQIYRKVCWYCHCNLFHQNHESFRVELSRSFKFCADVSFGGPERTRTAYLLIANEAFYQMNYGPSLILTCNKQLTIYNTRNDRRLLVVSCRL